MRVLFDISAGDAGLGHVGRSIGLMQALTRHGVAVAVRCQGDDSSLLRDAGFDKESGVGDIEYDWLVRDRPDHMSLDEVHSLPRRSRLALIDDSGPARRFADLVIGPPTSSWQDTGEGALLQGMGYVLLREEFRDLAEPDFHGPLVLTLGRVDPGRLTVPLRRILERMDRHVRVVPPRDLSKAELREPIFEPTSGMSSAFEGGCLAVTAFGHSLMEATAAGLPSVFISWDHQSAADAMDVGMRLPSAVYAGTASDPRVCHRTAELASRLLGSPSDWRAAREAARCVDGRGAQRVVEQMISISGRAEDPWRVSS